MEEEFPTKNKYRSIRRKLLVRKKERAKRLIEWRGWVEEGAIKLAEHLQFCRGRCCRNPRDGNSSHDKTRQELKSELKKNDWPR